MSKKWGWYSVLYHLADGKLEKMEDITKTGIYECLTFMCYKQDDMEINNVNVNI